MTIPMVNEFIYLTKALLEPINQPPRLSVRLLASLRVVLSLSLSFLHDTTSVTARGNLSI